MGRSSTGPWTSRSACSATRLRCSRTPADANTAGGLGSGKDLRHQGLEAQGLDADQDADEALMRRVVVTGMGIVSSIGNNTQEVLASLREAKSGIVHADKYAELGFRSQVHGAPNFDVETAVDRRAMRFLGEGMAWNHVAMEQAIRDSGL